MIEFDEWWEENFMMVSADRTEAEDIYNLGKQSQQAKIDELQARVDETVKWIKENMKSIPLEYNGYTTEEYVDADDLLDILKGDQL